MKLELEYRRDGELYDGQVRHPDGQVSFIGASFGKMLSYLSRLLNAYPEDAEVTLRRTDREGLLPYVLDKGTVDLVRKDPLMAAEMMTIKDASPLTVQKRIVERSRPLLAPPIPAGEDVLAHCFGEYIFTKVRAHELECPGCGFWGSYTSPRILNDPDRIGTVIKARFTCRKKCKQQLFVTADAKWASVRVEELLKLPLPSFYFPRGWNDGKPWVSREDLEKKYEDYLAEKEAACSETTV